MIIFLISIVVNTSICAIIGNYSVDIELFFLRNKKKLLILRTLKILFVFLELFILIYSFLVLPEKILYSKKFSEFEFVFLIIFVIHPTSLLCLLILFTRKMAVLSLAFLSPFIFVPLLGVWIDHKEKERLNNEKKGYLWNNQSPKNAAEYMTENEKYFN